MGIKNHGFIKILYSSKVLIESIHAIPRQFIHWKLIFLLLLLVGCEEPTPQELPPTQVTIFTVHPATLPASFEFVGVAESSHPVEIRARVEGYLIEIAYSEGEVVKKDQLLFRLDPEPFIASLHDSQGGLEKQKAILWDAQKTLERIKPLYEQNASSRRDYENAIAQVLASEASVTSAQANVDQTKLNLGYTYITSPINGLSSKANYREGSLITPSINGLLTTVSVIDPIWVNFSVSDNDLLTYGKEQAKGLLVLPKDEKFTVTLTLADGSEFPHKGEVNFKEPTLDQLTGTMMVRATFANPESQIMPGQFVKVLVGGANRPDALFVPQESVLQNKKGSFVYVITANQTAEAKQIEVGDWYKNYWIVKSGLKVGDQVVVDGNNKILPGLKVQMRNWCPNEDRSS